VLQVLLVPMLGGARLVALVLRRTTAMTVLVPIRPTFSVTHTRENLCYALEHFNFHSEGVVLCVMCVVAVDVYSGKIAELCEANAQIW